MTDAEQSVVEVEVQAPAVKEEPVKKRQKTAAPVEAPVVKKYITSGEHSHPFDIQNHGEVLQGQWTREGKKVAFDVPESLVEGFELHHHCVVGNIIEAPAPKEAK